jgi:predicted dinucleotide-binding enzyme
MLARNLAGMRIGMLGTGAVGVGLGSKLVEKGHEVRMGARSPDNEKARAWVVSEASRASSGTFADAARFGELLFLCTNGRHSVEALALAGAEALEGKVLIDVTNALDFSTGPAPILLSGNTDSIGERVQAAFPNVKVVKALNTMNWRVMADPRLVADGDHHVFLSGNDAAAKEVVAVLLRDAFGWKHVLDLGDITTARGTESFIAFWARVRLAVGTIPFNVKIVTRSED